MAALLIGFWFFIFLVAGSLFAVKEKEGRFRILGIFQIEGGVTDYWLRECRALRWRIRGRPDLMFLAAAALVAAIPFVLVLAAELVGWMLRLAS